MIAAIYTELLKFIKSKLLWVVILSSLVVPGLCMVADNKHGMYHYVYVGATFTSVFFGIILFSTYTASIFTVEYSEGTINTLFTTSVPRYKILIGKLATVFVMILLTMLLNIAFIMLFAKVIRGESVLYEGENLWGSLFYSIKVILVASVLQFMLIPFVALLSMWRKSMVQTIVFNVIVSVINFVLIDRPIKWTFLFPWESPGVQLLKSFDWWKLKTGIPGTKSSLILLLLIFVIGLAGSIVYYNKSDVYMVN